MKIELKMILIIVLSISLVCLIYYFYTKGVDYDKKIEEYESKCIDLESKRKVSQQKIDSINIEIGRKEIAEDSLIGEISSLVKLVSDAEKNAYNSKSKLDKMNKELNDARKKIEEFVPPNRTGESLIRSLKNKTL